MGFWTEKSTVFVSDIPVPADIGEGNLNPFNEHGKLRLNLIKMLILSDMENGQ